MKKLLIQFSDNVLSRNQMKAVKGGEGYGSATKDCPDPIPDVTCTGANGYTFNDSLGGGCKSDTEEKYCITI